MAGNFIVYLIGYSIAIVGVGFLMSAAGLQREWIVAAVLILIGLGVVYAMSRSQRDAVTRADRDAEMRRQKEERQERERQRREQSARESGSGRPADTGTST